MQLVLCVILLLIVLFLDLICPVTGAGRGIISGGGCAGHSIVIPGVGPSNKMVKTLCSHKCQF
jgi:hypothetical protein